MALVNSTPAQRNGTLPRLFGVRPMADQAPTPALRSRLLFSLAAAFAGGGCKVPTTRRVFYHCLHKIAIADIYSVDWEVVTCPAELVAKSGCSVTGYNSGNAPSVPASSATAQAISAAYSKASTLTPATSSKAHGSMSASVAPVAPASVSASLEMPVTSATAPVPTSGAINAFSSVAPVHPAKVHRPHWVPHQYKAHEAADHGYEEETEQDDCDAF